MGVQEYSETFFERNLRGSRDSARLVLPSLFQYRRPQSIVDVGCGLGAWLSAATELGVTEVLGIDGDHVERSALLIPESDFYSADLSHRVSLQRRFDLAICVEVAEHLPFERSESFVEDLTALSDVVLFSAALPYQGGTEHINEQWLEFWAILFRRHGYLPFDFLRSGLWGAAGVEFWYSQNLMIFCTEAGSRDFPPNSAVRDRPLSYPHPLTFLVNLARYRPLSVSARDVECDDYMNMLRAWQSGAVIPPPIRMIDAQDESGAPLFPESRILVADANAEISALRAEIRVRDTEIGRLGLEVRAEISGRQSDISAREAKISALTEEILTRDAEIGKLGIEVESARNQGLELLAKTHAQNHRIEALSGEIAALRNSLTWRLTKPVRLCIQWLFRLHRRAS